MSDEDKPAEAHPAPANHAPAPAQQVIGPSTPVQLTTVVGLVACLWMIYTSVSGMDAHIAVVEEKLSNMDKNIEDMAKSSRSNGQTSAQNSARIQLIEAQLKSKSEADERRFLRLENK